MKATKLLSLIIATLVGVSQSAWAGRGGGGGLVAATLVEAALVEVILADWTVLGLGAPDFAQPRRGSGVPILPVEVSADQPVRSDTTTEAAARLLLGHTNSADGETNR